MFVGELLSFCVKIRRNKNFGKICQHCCRKNPNLGGGGEGRRGGEEEVGKVTTDYQFHLSTRSINKMLKALGIRGRKMADIGAICIVALLLDVGFSPRTLEFSQLLVDFEFVVDKMALRQVYLLSLLFPSVFVTPTVPRIPSFLSPTQHNLYNSDRC
jgi:hypothetical protein